eukprot:CAMPEP_0182877594 /NCGR_PEP_ID=MMETSP0034_2-20130328/14855_1 /TAXON_ID=156128 /ORGANISM="Nephroselmis pyriformis, Strain CCMP717" /LENGTH=45 /DNA_ID= /DNA_START= /DNA_END= /DNA_ORIENTATION=
MGDAMGGMAAELCATTMPTALYHGHRCTVRLVVLISQHAMCGSAG